MPTLLPPRTGLLGGGGGDERYDGGDLDDDDEELDERDDDELDDREDDDPPLEDDDPPPEDDEDELPLAVMCVGSAVANSVTSSMQRTVRIGDTNRRHAFGKRVPVRHTQTSIHKECVSRAKASAKRPALWAHNANCALQFYCSLYWPRKQL